MAVRKVIARNSRELAAVLGLTTAEHAALRVQFELVEEIGRELKRVGLTHAALARLAQKVRVADEVAVADAMNFWQPRVIFDWRAGNCGVIVTL